YTPVGKMYPLKGASKEFLEIYKRGLDAKEKYTGYLTAHWGIIHYSFLRLEHVENYPAEMYWFYKNIPEEMLRRVYIEKDGLTLMQYLDFIEEYRMGWDKGYWLEYDGTGTLITENNLTENITEDRIAYLNGLFWNNPTYYKEKEMMQEYGFTEGNLMTFEWVVSHPKEAYELMRITWEPYNVFMLDVRIRKDSYFVERGIPILPDDTIS
ncbi:MAG: hypothetical protein LBH28_09080, partial [Oscillospiraceae bacterium]|nr:hypothetical protein [Oscillospiraceae bacterium]